MEHTLWQLALQIGAPVGDLHLEQVVPAYLFPSTLQSLEVCLNPQNRNMESRTKQFTLFSAHFLFEDLSSKM